MGKNQPRKLVLNRETVRELTSQDMEHVEGGNNQPDSKGNWCGTITGDPCKAC